MHRSKHLSSDTAVDRERLREAADILARAFIRIKKQPQERKFLLDFSLPGSVHGKPDIQGENT